MDNLLLQGSYYDSIMKISNFGYSKSGVLDSVAVTLALGGGGGQVSLLQQGPRTDEGCMALSRLSSCLSSMQVPGQTHLHGRMWLLALLYPACSGACSTHAGCCCISSRVQSCRLLCLGQSADSG